MTQSKRRQRTLACQKSAVLLRITYEKIKKNLFDLLLISQTYFKNNLEQLYNTYIQGKAKQASFQSKGSNDAIPYLSSVKTLLVVAEFGIRGSQTPAFL